MNFAKIVLKDIEGKEIKHELHKIVGNEIYAKTLDLGLLETAQKIYKGEDVTLNDAQKGEVRRVVNEAQFASFAKKAIFDEMK